MLNAITACVLSSLLLLDVLPPPQQPKDKGVEDEKKRVIAVQIPDEVRVVNPEVISSTMLYFGIAILVLTALLLTGEVAVVIQSKRGWGDWNSFRIVVVTFVLGLGAFLIVAGFSSNQIAPMTGIMGGVIGYLFAKNPRAAAGNQDSAPH
jgi:hypothetical protein